MTMALRGATAWRRRTLAFLILLCVLTISLSAGVRISGAIGVAQQPAQLSATPAARYDHTLVAINGRAYLFGGMGSEGPLSDLWLYDGSWQPVVTDGGPAARSRHAAVVVGGLMYIFFGQGDGGTLYGDIWTFDPLSRSWQQRHPVGAGPAARFGHSTVALGNEVLLFGGLMAGGPADDCAWRYRTASNEWEMGACLDRRSSFVGQAAAGVNGLMFVYPPDASLATLLRYAPQNDHWSDASVLDDGYAPRSAAAVAARDNRVWLFGGEIPGMGKTPNVLEFMIPADGSAALLRPLPCLPAARSHAQAVALSSGPVNTLTQVLVFGGLRAGQPVAESLIYYVGPPATATATPTRSGASATPTRTPVTTVTATRTATASATTTQTPTVVTPPALTWRVYLPLLLTSD